MAHADRRPEAEGELRRLESVLRACVKQAADGGPFFVDRQILLDGWIAQLTPVAIDSMGTKRLIALARDMGARVKLLEVLYQADKAEQAEARRQLVELDRAEKQAQAAVNARLDELDRAEKGRELARVRAAHDGMTEGTFTVPDHDLRNSGPG